MNSYLYPGFLILHLVGLTMMAGTTLIDLIGYRAYWTFYDTNKEKAEGMLQFVGKLARPVGIGAALLILTGFGMMILTHGVFGEQTWFRIKFGLVILLIANNLLFGRRQGVALRMAVAANEAQLPLVVGRIKRNLNLFHFILLVIFLTIIFLSVFKFN